MVVCHLLFVLFTFGMAVEFSWDTRSELLFCFIHNSHSTTLHVLMWKKRKNDGMV